MRVLFRLLAAAFALVIIAVVFFVALGSLPSLSIPVFPTNPSPSPSPVILTQADASRSISLVSGTHILLQLQDQFPVPGSSLVWVASSSSPAVLALLSQSSPSPAPGLGNAPYIATFVARSPGATTIVAHGATTCEAMAKSACPDRDFTITITVTP